MPHTAGMVRKRYRTPVVALACGLVFAVGGGALLRASAPQTWEIQSGRADDLRDSLAVIDAGGPPLLGRAKPDRALSPGAGQPGVRYRPIGVSDDQGIYVYVPVLAHVLGFDDPLDMLKWFYAVLFAVPLLLYPLVFYRLFDSLPAAIAAAVGLLVCIRLIGYLDIYWVAAWAMLTLLPPLLLLAVRWPRAGLAVMVALMLAASFASSIRGQSGLPILIGGAIVIVFMRPWRWWRKAGAVALMVLAYLSIASFGLDAVREHRDDWAGAALGANKPAAHVVWHSAYIGLGFAPNKYGIKYSDTVGFQHASRERPGVAYVSDEYESTLKKLYFRIVENDPWFVIDTTLKKAAVTVERAAPVLPFVLLVAAIGVLFPPDRARLRRFLLLLAPALVIMFLPPLAAVPLPGYELGWLGALAVVGLVALARVVSALDPVPLRESWARVRAWLAGGGLGQVTAVLRSRLGLVTVATLCLCLGLVAISVGYGPRFQREYDCWQALPAGADPERCQ